LPETCRWEIRKTGVTTLGAIACRGLFLAGDKPTIDAESAAIVANTTGNHNW